MRSTLAVVLVLVGLSTVGAAVASARAVDTNVVVGSRREFEAGRADLPYRVGPGKPAHRTVLPPGTRTRPPHSALGGR